MSKKVLLVSLLVIAVLIVGGAVMYLGKTDPKTITNVETLRPVTFLNGEANPDVVFKGYANKQLGVTFTYPEDWVLHVNSGNGYYPQTTLVVLHEDSMDPTQVRIHRYPLSLAETLKTTERVSPSHNPDMWNSARTTIEEGTLEGVKVVRRVQYQKNECAAIDYLYSINENTTGVVEVSGVCASHDSGYDALKVKVTESVRFSEPISNEKQPGDVMAYIVSIENNTIVLDYVDSFAGKEAIQEMIADGRCTKEEDCFQSVAISDRNVNPLTRTFTLAADVEITSERDEVMTLEQLKGYGLAFEVSGKRVGRLFNIRFNSKNEVSTIRGEFRP